jgi:protease IV
MDDNQSFSQDLINNLLAERKNDRLWRNIRFFTRLGFGFLIALALIIILIPKTSPNFNKKHFSLIRLNGVIMAGSNFSAARVIPELEKAFHDKKSEGVLLEINSPGGSPVQSELIHNAIERLKKETGKKVVVVGEDLLASGGYLIATAADKIYVSNDTITGSIGVIMSGLGFDKVLKKYDIERRVYTAGEHKDRFDSFKEQTHSDKTKANILLQETRKHFISFVEASRKHLKSPKQAGVLPADDTVFTGDFWNGSDAIKLGLADKAGDMYQAAKDNFDTEIFVDYTRHPSIIDSFVQSATQGIQHAALAISTPKVLAMSKVR